MAFAASNEEKGTSAFYLSTQDLYALDADGNHVLVVQNGKVVGGAAAYTDAKAQAAIKGKAQIKALTSASTLEQVIAALQA